MKVIAVVIQTETDIYCIRYQ